MTRNVERSDLTVDMTLSQLLSANLARYPGSPLLWTYEPEITRTVIRFGYDHHINHEKIGHVALNKRAMISGEIYRKRDAWELDNNSGA